MSETEKSVKELDRILKFVKEYTSKPSKYPATPGAKPKKFNLEKSYARVGTKITVDIWKYNNVKYLRLNYANRRSFQQGRFQVVDIKRTNYKGYFRNVKGAKVVWGFTKLERSGRTLKQLVDVLIPLSSLERNE